jgi:glycosyltransferase involved in cell wall biosynthesis
MRVLLVHNNYSRFVALDDAILRQQHVVREWHPQGRRVNLAALFAEVRGCDLVFAWFASWHSLWPILVSRLLRKPAVLVVGGYDVAAMPEIGYGNQRGGMRKLVSRWAISAATNVVTVSRFSLAEMATNMNLRKTVEVIYHGVPDVLSSDEIPHKEAMALTAGAVEFGNLEVKGHAAFIEAARLLPEVEFFLVGPWRDGTAEAVVANAPANLSLTGYLEPARLDELYRRASVYVQVSKHESFGMSVAEAMTAGCIPVVSREGALPEVVGQEGVYVDDIDGIAVAAAIRKAIASDDASRASARQRILTEFPMERRRTALLQLVRVAAGQHDDI